jgi:hypothetical protein
MNFSVRPSILLNNSVHPWGRGWSLLFTSHLKISLSSMSPAENPSTGFLLSSANCFRSWKHVGIFHRNPQWTQTDVFCGYIAGNICIFLRNPKRSLFYCTYCCILWLNGRKRQKNGKNFGQGSMLLSQFSAIFWRKYLKIDKNFGQVVENIDIWYRHLWAKWKLKKTT